MLTRNGNKGRTLPERPKNDRRNTAGGPQQMLTKKQLELLKFIDKRVQRDGVPPSFDEMKEALDLRSKSGIHRKPPMYMYINRNYSFVTNIFWDMHNFLTIVHYSWLIIRNQFNYQPP